MDDQTKAKGLMAAGLFILAAIGLIVMLVVLPAIRSGGGSPTVLAQGTGAGGLTPTPGMEPGPGEMPGGAAPAMPGGTMPTPGGMPGGATGMPGAGGMPAGGAVGAGGAAAAAPAKAVEPLEPSRENPFAPMGAVGGKAAEKVRPELAFRPSPAAFPIGVREQNRFPTVGPSGQTIRVPSGAPSVTGPAGPQLPPGEEYLRVTAIMRDAQGRAMVVLQAAPGQEGTVLQVGDRYQGYRVEKITNTEMVLAKQEGGQVVRKVLRLQVGGGPRRPTGAGGQPGGARPGVTVPGGRQPGGGGTAPGGQPGIRRPGGGGGGFPGVGGGGAAQGANQ